MLDEIALLFLGSAFAGGHSDHALAAAALRPERANGGSLDEAAVSNADDASFVGDQVLHVDLCFVRHDLSQPRRAEFVANFAQLLLDDLQNSLLLRQDVTEVFDRSDYLFVFLLDFFPFQAGQLIEAKVENFVGLLFAEGVAAFYEPRRAANDDADLFHLSLGEIECEQFHPRFLAVGRLANDADEFIQVFECDQITFQRFGALLSLSQFKARAPQDHLAPMLDVAGVGFLEREQLGAAVIDRQHQGREGTFHRGEFVKIVNDDFRVGVPFQLDHDAVILIRPTAHVADVRDHYTLHQLRDALDQRSPIHAVGNLRDDNLLPAAFEFFHAGFAAHLDAAPSGLKILADSVDAADDASGGKIRALHMLHQFIEGDVGVVDLRADSINDLRQIVWRNVGRHADGNAGAAVDEQIWKRGGENGGLGARFVVVGDEVHRLLVHVGHHCGAQMSHARFGITHGRWRIALHRTEVPLAIHERFAHGPGLRHVDQCGVDHRFAVRMIIAARIAADFSAFAMLASREKSQVVHGVENSPLRRFQAVPSVRQRPGNDDRH